MGLGDRVQEALERIGVTEDQVQRWLGPECGCEERKQKLNSLGSWANRVIQGRVQSAREYLNRMLGEE